MITRLYANNFRCLVAFKTEFDSFGVLCGPNGAGTRRDNHTLPTRIGPLKIPAGLTAGEAVARGWVRA